MEAVSLICAVAAVGYLAGALAGKILVVVAAGFLDSVDDARR